jgi:Uma2 family endonuclease
LPPEARWIGPDSAGIRMTPEEFDAIEAEEYDEDYRYELVHGVLVVTPFATESETDPDDELGHWLRTYRDTHPRGSVLDETVPEHFLRTPNCRRRADRVIWSGLGRPPRRGANVPAIVVEFVAPGKRSWRRDYVEKRDEYVALGVREYWVFDRFRRTLTVFQRTQPHETVVSEAETYRSALLPGFELPIGRLLAKADQWVEE